VGQLRHRLGIHAPATTGDPLFERAYRAQMNTLEQLVLVLPLLWVATLFLHGWTWTPAALTAVWIVGRIVYATAYMADPERRGLGYRIGAFALAGLLIASLVGLVQAALAPAQ
jgi:glutathione S-transferase